MTDAAKKLLEVVLALPEEDQRWLSDKLVEAVRREPEGGLSDAWKREIVRRLEQVRSGEVQAVPGAEVEARLRQSLERARQTRADD